MPPPYRSDEVAEAIIDAADRANLRLERLEVWSDDASRSWIVLATLRDREHRMNFPFASAAGVYTPAEIAAHLVANSWPFTR